MKQRVECNYCENFISPKFKDDGVNIFLAKKISNAKCKLGKRVMFRMPTDYRLGRSNEGYFRYCEQFKK